LHGCKWIERIVNKELNSFQSKKEREKKREFGCLEWRLTFLFSFFMFGKEEEEEEENF